MSVLDDVLYETISVFGKDIQMLIAIEEMAELTKELIKIQRSPDFFLDENVKEEIADVQIMLDQLKIIFGLLDIEEIESKKLLRLRERLDEYKKINGEYAGNK